MKLAVASRLTHSELGSSPPRPNWISKATHHFSAWEMCCLPDFFLSGAEDVFWHPYATSGADRWDKNSKVGIRVDTPTCQQTRRTSEPAAPHSRDGHISLFGFPRKTDETDEWDHGKAIWDIDNAISANQRNGSVYPIWLLQNFPGK